VGKVTKSTLPFEAPANATAKSSANIVRFILLLL
jgi:hypothetical protein